MNDQRLKKWARYAAILGGVLVPALVIAQQQINPPADNTFAANTVLRAADVEQLRDALATALTRINALEANAGVTKGQFYAVTGSSPLVAQNGTGLATANCLGVRDVMVSCGCSGDQDGFNSTQFDLRRVEVIQQDESRVSSCVCQADNVGTNASRTLVAHGSCLRAP